MTQRDRWMLALLPAVLTIGAYVYGVRGKLNRQLDEAVSRAEAAEKKKGSGTSDAQLLAKRREISETEEKLSAAHKRVQQLETDLNATKNRKVELTKPVEALQLPPDHPAALVQQRLRRIFEKHGLTRAASDDAERADPVGIVSSLLQAAPELQPAGSTRAIHRFRIVGSCKVLRAFLEDLATLEPSALPLTFELTRDAEFQVMEMTLWLWF